MRVRIFGQQIALSMAALAVVEAAIFFSVLLAVGHLHLGVEFPALERTAGPLWPRALLYSMAMATCLLALGLYSARQRARRGGVFLRVLIAATICVAITATYLNIIRDPHFGRVALALATMSAAAVIYLLRLSVSRLLDGAALKRRVLVYGTGGRASVISQLRRRADQRSFSLIGFVQPDGEALNVAEARVLRPAGGLLEFCQSRHVDEVVLAMDDQRRAFPARELLECRMAGVAVTDLLTFLEREAGRVWLDVFNPSWLIFGKGFRRGSLRAFTCSLLDVIASVALLALAAPLILATIIAIKLEDGWRSPVFYRQARVGLGGRTFKLLKFRSMGINAEADGEARWATKRDPRVTRVGAIIRTLRIDELPQILNVLRGDMCIVGPRPERPKFVEELARNIPYYAYRHCVKPGITGWAQLCYAYGSSEQDAVEKLQYDLYYIKNSGLLFDLSILVQTAEVVLFGKGAR
ncbi:MAG TPA: TIGR03013 family XrtA/PEP-CTERM system glycosyltransferase [Xanthobacteraceae bacterium]|jgi:sugar transferase (PEP-CTERM system associated)